MAELLTAVTGMDIDTERFLEIGERIFTLEKMFNYREGFRRADDTIPDRFFSDAFTQGPEKGAKLDRGEFKETLEEYYREREWDPRTTRPNDAKLRQLGLDFVTAV